MQGVGGESDGSGYGKWANVRGGSVGGDMWKRMKEAGKSAREEEEARKRR